MYYILSRDEVMADKAALNYFVIYLLAVPLYLFFNVEVTNSFIPGMEAPLYHDEFTLAFFTTHDPMDNAVPSLHIGLPISLLILNRLHCRDLGIEIKDWRHREFDVFVMANVAIYFFSIQYLGIHWVVDIIPGIILAIVCAMFCHSLQPILRKTALKDWKELLPDRKQSIFAIVSVLLFSGVLIFGAIDGPGADEDTPNYRLGDGDVKLDTIEVHSLSHPVGVEIRNVGEYPVGVMIVDRDEVVPYSDKGIIDWDSIIADSTMDSNFRLSSLAEGELLNTEVDIDSLFDSYLVLLRVSESSDGIAEVRITMEYVDDELIWSALLASWPSFIIFGIVVEGYVNRLKQIESDDISDIDSR